MPIQSLTFRSQTPEAKFRDMDGQFATQEYIQQLIRADPADVATICKLPAQHDKLVWTLEHLRCEFCIAGMALPYFWARTGYSSRR